MKLFFVPVPVFDENMFVHYYRFKFKNSNDLLLDGQGARMFDGNINPKILQILDDVGIQTLTLGKPLLIPFTNLLLLSDFHKTTKTEPSNIIIALDSTVTDDEIYIKKILECKQLGYKFAILFSGIENYKNIIKFADYIIIKQTLSNKEASTLIKKYPEKIHIASNIKNFNIFRIVKSIGYKRFEGKFYTTPISISSVNDVKPNKTIAIQLLNIIKDDNFEINDVSKLIEKDISISVLFLKYINKIVIGTKIKTIRHAASMLGQKEIKKWVITAVFMNISSDIPSELNRVSLIRAKFAENLAKYFNLEEEAESLFLMGLFSLVDVMLGLNLQSALKMLNISENIIEALVNNKGIYFPVYEFIELYEAGNWTNVSRFLIIQNIPAEELYNMYIDSLNFYKNVSFM
ncbi:MAG: HDOD domain-containing protein [Defluviitaleaceae bacterium]|nr:HDOD domain-containing protein [Defluviitaleaceae bacterium]